MIPIFVFFFNSALKLIFLNSFLNNLYRLFLPTDLTDSLCFSQLHLTPKNLFHFLLGQLPYLVDQLFDLESCSIVKRFWDARGPGITHTVAHARTAVVVPQW